MSIMQGCNMKCAFCIVPKTRGKERYRSIQEIAMEVRSLAAGGVREVTLLGQIVNAYGRGMLPRKEGKSPFVQLLETLHEIEGIKRSGLLPCIRLHSGMILSMHSVAFQSLVLMPTCPCRAGSDRILKAMNRPYSIERFLDIVRKLREAIEA